MNATHIHLLLNHFPIIGTLLGSGLLLWGIIKKQNNLKTAAAAILALMAIIAIPVYLTGEPAEETVENLPGVSEAMIELHEEAANLAIWVMMFTGAIALVAVIFSALKRTTASALFIAVFILSAISFGTMARTGYYGGKIRHSELNNGTAAGGENAAGNEAAEKEEGEQGEGKKAPVVTDSAAMAQPVNLPAGKETGKEQQAAGKKDDDD